MAAATIGVGLLAIAVGLILGVPSTDDDGWLRDHGVPVDGTVQTIGGLSRGAGFRGYTYVFSYDGQLHRESATNGADGFYPGAPVTVLVDPENPSRSVVQGRGTSTSFRSSMSVVAMVVGTLIVLMGLRNGWRCWRARVPRGQG